MRFSDGLACLRRGGEPLQLQVVTTIFSGPMSGPSGVDRLAGIAH